MGFLDSFLHRPKTPATLSDLEMRQKINLMTLEQINKYLAVDWERSEGIRHKSHEGYDATREELALMRERRIELEEEHEHAKELEEIEN